MLVELKDIEGEKYIADLEKEELDSLYLEMHYDLTAQIEIDGKYKFIVEATRIDNGCETVY